MPWTNTVETRTAMIATMTITRIRHPFVRRMSTIVLSGGLVRSIADDGSRARRPRRLSRTGVSGRRTGVIRRRSIGTGWLAAAVVLAVGCAGPVVPPAPSQSDGAAAAASTPAGAIASDSLADLQLDDASRDLLTVLGPADPVMAQVTTTQVEELAAAARSVSLRVEEFPDAVYLRGPLGTVLDVIASVPVSAVYLGDEDAAERPIPADRPLVGVPVSGRPYVVSGVTPEVGDLSELRISSPERDPLLRSLAAAIRTIDGQPYRRLQVDGSCGPEQGGAICRISAIGWSPGSGNREDDIALQGTEKTGWSGILLSDSTSLWSVPRPVLRSAEWTARHDPAAAAAIHRYATCCNAGWDPTKPGWIKLAYLRPCPSGSLAIGRQVAATGECFDVLTIVVDIGPGTVVSIDERPGP